MIKKGFTLIELLIVIAIISILVGVAVPYYNDYITDARLSVLKQNLATFRNSINQFRGDNLRGPFLVDVADGGTVIHTGPFSGAANGSELVSGPIQIVEGLPTKRSNIKYLPSMPVLQDPLTGANLGLPNLGATAPSAYFYDANANGRYDFDLNNDANYSDSEFAFLDGNNNGIYDSSAPYVTTHSSKFDTILFFDTATGTNTILPLDYTSLIATDAAGISY